MNVTDPDSRNIKAPRGYLQGYNAQAATKRRPPRPDRPSTAKTTLGNRPAAERSTRPPPSAAPTQPLCATAV